MRLLLILALSGCIRTAPPKPIDPTAASQAAAALRIGAHLAGSLESLAAAVEAFGGDATALETPASCAVSRITEGVLKAAATGVESASTAPELPAGSVSLSGCGLEAVAVDPAVPIIVGQVAQTVKLSLDLGGVSVKDPCGYTYAVAVLDLVDDVIGDVLAGGVAVEVAWDARPLTGVECAL